jgi:hypothetical protein
MPFHNEFREWASLQEALELLEEGVENLGIPEESLKYVEGLGALDDLPKKEKAWLLSLATKLAFISTPVLNGEVKIPFFLGVDGMLKTLVRGDIIDASQSYNIRSMVADQILELTSGSGATAGIVGLKAIKRLAKSIKGIMGKVVPREVGFDVKSVPFYGQALERWDQKIEQMIGMNLLAALSRLTLTNQVLQSDHRVLPMLAKALAEPISSVKTTEDVEKFEEIAAEASTKALNQIKKKERGETVIKNPDGSYWQDLKTTSCPIEAARMSHCGKEDDPEDGVSLYSLRIKGEDDENSKSLVTISFNKGTKTVYQIKGYRIIDGAKMGNHAPPETFEFQGKEYNLWDNIVNFFKKMGVEYNLEAGAYSQYGSAFEEMTNYIDSLTGVVTGKRPETDLQSMFANDEERFGPGNINESTQDLLRLAGITRKH